MKIMVAIPAYDGKLHVETVMSLLAENVIAASRGYHMVVRYNLGNSILPRARNKLVAEFLASDCTDFFFIDGDLGWEAGKLCDLCERDEDIVGGVYPTKVDKLNFPVRWLKKDELWAENGVIEVEGISTGFMRIKRRVLEALVSDDLAYEESTLEGKKAWAIFDFGLMNGQYYGEDFIFCMRAREKGFRVWLDPEIGFDHVGYKAFSGKLGDWLRERMNDHRA